MNKTSQTTHVHCCKSHVWTILCVRIARESKPLNWSAITTKYHRNYWTCFKIHNIYTKGRNLTFKIVYSIGLGGSKIKTKPKTTKLIFRFRWPSGHHNQHLWYAIDIYSTALFKDGARKHKRRIGRRIFYGTHMQQIAHADMFARVLTCAYAR